jgi:hypothetical protein
MVRRIAASGLVVVLALAAVALPAQAGGWALVTLDTAPTNARAGQELVLGFMVKQHGVTPTHQVEPFLLATHQVTRETVQARGKKDDAIVGHFSVAVTFPSAGVWDWSITPEPFAGTKLDALTVLTAAGDKAALSAAGEAAAVPEQAPARKADADDGSRFSVAATASAGVVALLVVAAVGLAWRQVTRRRDTGGLS